MSIMATEPVMSPWRRAGYAALSGVSGWLAGQIVCLPVNLITAVRNSEGQPRLFVQTLLYGLLVWSVWTLFLAIAAWLLVVLPLVMTMRPCLVVRLRVILSIVATLGALSLSGLRPSMFRDSGAVSFFHKFALVIPYGAFAVSFTLVTTWMYILLSKRRLDQAAEPIVEATARRAAS
jgi:hypothetical protein